MFFFFFKQKTAYEITYGDWSSDVCSSDLPNSEVRIGIADLATRRTAWVDLGSEKDIYVAAMDFAGSGNEIWLSRLNRHQNRLDLLLADATSGASRTIMADSDAA